MTVSAQTLAFEYAANGVTTTFPYGFRVLYADQVKVYVNGTLQVGGYTLTGVGDAGGGNVIFSVAPVNGSTVLVRRISDRVRSTDFQQAPYFTQEELLDIDQDYQTMLLQEAAADGDNSLRIPAEETLETLLPAAELRANKAIVFDALGNVTVSEDDYEDQVASVAASAAAALASENAAEAAALAASNSEAAADASEAAAAASAAAASASANAAAGTYYVATKSAGNTLASSLPNGATVIVTADESQGGFQVRYTVASGLLSSATVLSNRATRADVRLTTASISPSFVEGLSLRQVDRNPANALVDTPDNAPGLEIAVTGVAGSKVLTTTETAKVAGLGSAKWQAALISTDGLTGYFDVAISNNGTNQITMKTPLENDFVGTLGNVIADSQHYTPVGMKAYAHNVSRQSGYATARGGVMGGSWIDGPSDIQALWVKNAALVSYGVINSAAPIVQTSLTNSPSAQNVFDTLKELKRPISLAKRGAQFGTHLAGHGATATFNGSGKNCVLELWTSAVRGELDLQGVAEMSVVVKNDGVEIYNVLAEDLLKKHVVPIIQAGEVLVEVKNTSNGIFLIEVSQTTFREAGLGGLMIGAGQRVVCLGDSWFERHGGIFAKTLGEITGATVITRALGGMTTFWGLSWFDQYVKAEKPDVCLFHFLINDSNILSGLTYTDPDGNVFPRWPSGLTSNESRDLWTKNIYDLCRRCIDLGIKPIVVLPSHTQGAFSWVWNLDKSAPLEWLATATQLSDPLSYINNYGKYTGAIANRGTLQFFAEGSLPESAWRNRSEEALRKVQSLSLMVDDYDTAPQFDIGVDSNADGLSNGLFEQTTPAKPLTFSIVSAAQRMAITFDTTPGNSNRLGFSWSLVSGKRYLFVFDCLNGPANESLFIFSNIQNTTTGYNEILNSGFGNISTDALGNGPLYFGLNCLATEVKSLLMGFNFSASTSKSIDFARAYAVDIDALLLDAPNLAGSSDAELASFVLSLA